MESQCMWNQDNHCLSSSANGPCYTTQQLNSGVCDQYGMAGNKVVGIAGTFTRFFNEMNNHLKN